VHHGKPAGGDEAKVCFDVIPFACPNPIFCQIAVVNSKIWICGIIFATFTK